MINLSTLQQVVEEGLERTGLSARKASLCAVEREDLVRDIRRGRMPSFDKVISLLDVLDISIEFHQKPVGVAAQLHREYERERRKERMMILSALPENLTKPPSESQKPGKIAAALGLRSEASTDDILAAITALVERAERTGENNDRWDQDQVQAELAALREAIEDLAAKEPPPTYRIDADLNDPTALAVGAADESNVYQFARPDPEGDDPSSSARPLDVVELAAAAGAGAEVLDETVAGQLWFRRDWLDRHDIDPAQCVVIGVRGESMEPALPDNCSILVDRSRRRRLNGHVYVLRTADGVVVKRLVHDDDGWQVLSDHPAWQPQPWDDDNDIIGEVRWTARRL